MTRAADDAIRHARETGPADRVITCASGASPSGPIHLGNLREFITPHFVAEEIRGRGIAVRHLHSWDDYDRFRKVPAGVDPSWAEHIGRPLTAVPDPWGCHDSWATHFKEPLRAALAENYEPLRRVFTRHGIELAAREEAATESRVAA